MNLAFIKKLIGKKPKAEKKASQNSVRKPPLRAQRIVPGSVDSIQVDLDSFPKIRLEQKPKNTEYDSIRMTYLRQAFHSIRPYFDFLCSLEGIKENEDIQLVMRDVIFRYIETFWDMPASQEHHHSHLWGGLVHSLDTACREAKEFQSGKVFSAYGVDSERSQKDVMWQAFGGFLVGMLHDVGKIFDVEIQSAGQQRVTFAPMQGRLLDFYLVHPEGRKVRWKTSPDYTKICWNMMFAWTYVPTEVYREMPHDIMIDVMRKLLTYDSLKSDQASVKSWMAKSADEVTISRELRALIADTGDFFNSDMSPKKSFYCCKVDDNWYACNTHLLPQMLAKKVGCKEQDIIQMFRRNKLLGVDLDSNNYYAKIAFVQKGKEYPKSVLFLRSSLIDACLDKPAPVADVTFAESSREAIVKLFGQCSPFIDPRCFANQEEELVEPAKVQKPAAQKPKGKAESKQKQPEADISSCIPKKPVSSVSVDPVENPEGVDATSTPQMDAVESEGGMVVEQAATASEAVPEVAFYKAAGKSITEEQALDLFEQFLSRIKEGKVQQPKGAIVWLSQQGDLYFSYPSAINAALEIPANAGELSDDTKKLRSKFIAALSTLGIVDDSHDAHAESTITFYPSGYEEGRPPVSLATGQFVKLNLDAVMNRCSRFDVIIQKLFSTINAVKADQMSGGAR